MGKIVSFFTGQFEQLIWCIIIGFIIGTFIVGLLTIVSNIE